MDNVEKLSKANAIVLDAYDQSVGEDGSGSIHIAWTNETSIDLATLIPNTSNENTLALCNRTYIRFVLALRLTVKFLA